MTAFKIPFGYGLYMPPNVIHCDSFLTGRFLIAYTNAKNFTTGILRTTTGDVTQVNISKNNKDTHVLDVASPREFYCLTKNTTKAKRNLMSQVLQNEAFKIEEDDEWSSEEDES
jgi:hypothetical protein